MSSGNIFVIICITVHRKNINRSNLQCDTVPRARPPLKQKSITDYIVTDSNLLQVSGSVQVDTVDIGKSDHFLIWMELGRTVKTTKQQKRVIKKWHIERFQDEEVRQKYQEALSVEVDGFQGRVHQ